MGKISISLWIIFVLFGIYMQYVRMHTDIRIVFCNVGQGDGILVLSGEKQVVIDGGKDSSFLECLGKYMPLFDRNIEYVVVTHPDIDHIGGLIDVFNRYKVDQIITNAVMKGDVFYRQYFKAVRSSSSKIHFLTKGSTFSVEDMHFTVLLPQQVPGNTEKFLHETNDALLEENIVLCEEKYRNTNSGSYVLKLKIGPFSALFTGDMEKEQERALISSGVLQQIDVLKVSHHGSNSASSDVFIKKILPQVGVISVGRENTYGHPSLNTLDLLERNGVNIYRTDIDGDISIYVRGDIFSVISEYGRRVIYSSYGK